MNRSAKISGCPMGHRRLADIAPTEQQRPFQQPAHRHAILIFRLPLSRCHTRQPETVTHPHQSLAIPQ
ncbi:hypothetical protein [Kingella sp. (in: b-proteobacteria)]|uniref:hypothetical protein n=1 Tax=Kingella sp. (in: b-proteobacteria) TaxID=2020713 RepID=UPI0026DB6209|nr:hypothetical protein [Kingella sp. (in: b-proteobacteria)]MDO4658309.1 hypothetical protein [Kingella sp. (in: b-proteobacteria)]